MNIFDEIQNRWHRVFEQTTDEKKIAQVQAIDPLTIAADLKTLQEHSRQLEREVAALQNQPFSSSVGPLLDIRNGELYYRLHGLFVSVTSVYQALDHIVKLLKTDASFAKKFRAQFGEKIETDIRNIFNFPA